MKKRIYAVLFLFMFSSIACAEEFKEGVDYRKVSQQETDSGDKIEVLEFFWYGCPHCYQFDPTLSNWLKTKPENVEFIRVPVIFRPDWKVHARTYYALQVMGLGEKLHTAIFDEIHKLKKRGLDTEKSMTEFVVAHGVDKDEFTEMYTSFPIDNMMRKAINKTQAYGIRGVPSMAVNGKYVVSVKSSGRSMMTVVDYLIDKETAGSTTK